MPSPFPGMNPYLEQNDTWEDFHANFIIRAQEVLSTQVGQNYLVKVEVRPKEVERHSSLEILDRRNRRVVTVVELLSPSDKTMGPDRDDYLAKRRQVLAGTTHLVEIDLRRGGIRPLIITCWSAATKIGRASGFGRSACVIRCRSCQYLWRYPTRTPTLT
jgi:hypothetical protein